VRGWLASDHTPYVTIELLEAGVEREFVVDTGFSRSLYLPEDKIADWNLRFITSAPMVLANQRVVIADVFETTVVWFSVRNRVPVIAGPRGCDSLLGMELLEGCRIDLDRVLAVDLGDYSGMAKTERQVFHRQRYREAVQAVGKIGSQVLDWVICRDVGFEQVGYTLGWSSRPQAHAAAVERTKTALDELCRLWGTE